MTTPYEQFCLYASVGVFIFKGIPSIKEGWKSYSYNHCKDEIQKTKILEQLKLNLLDAKLVKERMRFLIMRGGIWALVPVAITAYVMNAKKIFDLSSKIKKK